MGVVEHTNSKETVMADELARQYTEMNFTEQNWEQRNGIPLEENTFTSTSGEIYQLLAK